ncbi:hypothetical protein SDJN02_08056, partial [Cucurbita argyrosperma subsp. argyrosperma]
MVTLLQEPYEEHCTGKAFLEKNIAILCCCLAFWRGLLKLREKGSTSSLAHRSVSTPSGLNILAGTRCLALIPFVTALLDFPFQTFLQDF